MEVRPEHYVSENPRSWECWDIIDKLLLVCTNSRDAFYIGVVVKYLYRYMTKGDREDIRKAITYLNRIILENGEREE